MLTKGGEEIIQGLTYSHSLG